MKFKLPDPTWFHKVGVHGEHRFYDSTETQPEGCTPLYTAQAMRDVLEQAVKEAERMTMYPGGRQEAPAHDTPWHAARAIRKMIGEIK